MEANTVIDVSMLSADFAANKSLNENFAIIDCRSNLLEPEAGRAAYLKGHIPGAQFASLNDDLSAPIEPGITGRHPLPDKETLASTIRRLGIQHNQKVIAYDANNGAYAARLWWILRYLGHDQVWVLDGGYDAWLAAGNEVTLDITEPKESDFDIENSISLVTDASVLGHTSATIIDARDEARFRGEQEPIDPIAGHIPGAMCRPFSQNLDEFGKFKTAEILRAQLIEAGISNSEPSICYCGSGVTACHNILAMIRAGFPEPYLYAGSWSEWITDGNRPVEVGA